MKRFLFIAFCVLSILFVSCGTTRGTFAQAFPALYEDEPPVSILVMPPINKTTNVDAKDFLYYTLQKNLADCGYYTFPAFLSMQTLQTESAYDSELFLEGDISKFGSTFGADMLLFTTINKWEKKAVASNKILVFVTYELRSTATGETVWSEDLELTYDATSYAARQSLAQIPFGYFVGWIIDIIISKTKVAVIDHVSVARTCNTWAFYYLPKGYYHPDVGLDSEKNAGPEKQKCTDMYLRDTR